MNKTILYLTIVLSVVGISLGGYYVMTHTAVLIDTQPSATPAAKEPTADTQTSPKPNHGDFEKRFEPKPPPSKGAKS